MREYIWENFGGGSFRSGSENGLSLIPVDFSNLRAIYDYKDLSFNLPGIYVKQMQQRDAPPYHTLLSYWDASAIAAQNWLTRYPTVDSANKLSHAKRIRQIPSTNVLIRDVTDLDTSKDRKSSWAIPPIKFQSYRWLLRCSAVHAPRDISRFTFFSSPKVIGCYFILSFSHFNLN